MKYLENTFKFFGKFFLLAIPLYIVYAVYQILLNPAMLEFSEGMTDIVEQFGNNTAMPYEELMNLYTAVATPLIPAIMVAFAAFVVLGLLVYPATYGVINKALTTGHADLTDFLSEFKNNIGRFILFALGNALIYIILVIASVLITVVFGFMGSFGAVLIVLFYIALLIGILVLRVFLFYWFPAMVMDKVGVIEGLKRSFRVAKSYFWPTIGISLLIWVATMIGSAFMGAFTMIPIFGALIASVLPALSEFIYIAFYFIVYKDKTSESEEEYDSTSGSSGEYLS